MNVSIDELFSDLYVLSLLKENGRLSIANGKLSIENYNTSQGLVSWMSLAVHRWWNQDSRHNTINTLHLIILKAQEAYKEMMITNDKLGICRLESKCKTAIKGMHNLHLTYVNDASMLAKLQMIIERFEIIINDISKKKHD